MKKLIALLASIVFIFGFTTPALAYDGPTFPDSKTESTWHYFNPETIRFFNFDDEESPCPYEIQLHVSDLVYNDTTVSVYAYYDTITSSEGTWMCDGLGHSIDITTSSYEGYFLFEASTGLCISLSNGVSVVATADGLKVTINKNSDFEECPYDLAMLISEETFMQKVDGVPVKVFSYTYDHEPGVWMSDAYGHTADFRGAGYFTTISNHTIQLVDGGKSINVYPTKSGFHTQIN